MLKGLCPLKRSHFRTAEIGRKCENSSSSIFSIKFVSHLFYPTKYFRATILLRSKIKIRTNTTKGIRAPVHFMDQLLINTSACIIIKKRGLKRGKSRGQCKINAKCHTRVWTTSLKVVLG